MVFVSVSLLAVCFIIGHNVTVLSSPTALRTWLDAGAVLNQLICASDRVHRDPFHTRSVGTEVSAAAAVSLQAHRPFDFTHICSPCLPHHGNSAIPRGLCCARPSLCGQFRTNHLLLMASHESILSRGNVGSPCCYLRKRMVDSCCPPSPKWRGRRPPLFPCIHQILPTPMLHPPPALLPSNYFPAFLSRGCVDGPGALTYPALF